MNVQLIEKLIKADNETCPELNFSNPLIDKNVTRALSKSFVKILNIAKENSNQNLRLAVLQNIRKTCQIEPNEHIKVDEKLTEVLATFYENYIQDNLQTIDKKLDAFLIRKSKEISINSFYPSSINPEIAQALMNLNEKDTLRNSLTNDLIHWDQENKKCLTIIKELWNSDKTDTQSTNNFDDASIKIKKEIEIMLLEISYTFVQNDDIDIDDVLSNNKMFKNVISTCSVSSECFQICINILNTLFIKSCFHSNLHEFIYKFIQKVKLACSKISFAVLYPYHLVHIVTLLDFDLDVLTLPIKVNYIKETVNYLKIEKNQCETDLIMLLSHFPQWFEIYFEE